MLRPIVFDIASVPAEPLLLKLVGYLGCEMECHEAAPTVDLLLNGRNAFGSEGPGRPLHAVGEKDDSVSRVEIGDV